MKVTWAGLANALNGVLIAVPIGWLSGLILLFVVLVMPKGGEGATAADILSPAQTEGYLFAFSVISASVTVVGLVWLLSSLVLVLIAWGMIWLDRREAKRAA